jgi:RND superfamily putative drug exporter
MDDTTRSNRTLAARMGRWSADHWKAATLGWLAFVAVAFLLGGMVGVTNVDRNAPGPGESGRMNRILDDGFQQPATEHVLVQSRAHRAGDRAFRVAIADVGARLSEVAVVQDVGDARISSDGRSALVDLTIRGDADTAVDRIEPVLDAVAAAQRAHPGFVIGQFGDASAEKEVETTYGQDLGKAGLLSLPVTLVILVLAFGALVAAGIPLLLGLTAVFATFGLIALPSHIVPVAMGRTRWCS